MLMLVIREQFTMDALLKSLMQLIIGALLVSNAEFIAGKFLGMFSAGSPSGNTSNFGATALGKLVASKFVYVAVGFNVPIWQVGIPGAYLFIDDIGTALAIVVGSVMVLMAQIQCAIAVCSALIPAGIEIGLRLKLAPIVFAMSATTGWGEHTVTYLKSCIGCAITPAIIVAIVGQAGAIEALVTGAVGSSLLGQALGISIGYKIMSGFVGQARGLVTSALH